ncbi:hypothetical protein WA026_011577, partial [Henosepilachna vigintioctopunctata]
DSFVLTTIIFHGDMSAKAQGNGAPILYITRHTHIHKLQPDQRIAEAFPKSGPADYTDEEEDSVTDKPQ